MAAEFLRVKTSAGTVMSVNTATMLFASASPTMGYFLIDMVNGHTIEVEKTPELFELFKLKGNDPASAVIKTQNLIDLGKNKRN